MKQDTKCAWSGKCLAVLCLVLSAASGASAEEPGRPIRALLVLGGCCHDYAEQKDLLAIGLSRRMNVVWTIAYDSNTTTYHKNPIYDRPEWSKDIDVVVHDECSSDVNDLKVIESILKPHRDGLPAVILHCGMHSYRTDGWNRKVATPWMQFTGLISTGHGPQAPIAVKFVDHQHPITRSLADWTTVNEELYNNASGKLEPTAHPLATGTQVFERRGISRPGRPASAEAVVAWSNLYNGKTRVFATTLGHNNATVDDPRYLDLVARGLLWSVDRLDTEQVKGGPPRSSSPARP